VSKAKQYWILILFAAGISVNNTIAVFDAMFSKKNEFLRTPKFGIKSKSDKWKHKDYVLPFNRTTLLEIFFSLYGCLAVFICIFSGNIFFLPIVTIQTIGFVYITYLSIVDSWEKASILTKGQLKISQSRLAVTAYSGTINNLQDKVLIGPSGKGMWFAQMLCF
jgi:hypothetical protein